MTPNAESNAIPAVFANKSGRIPELDGLRGIAIALVVYYHCIFNLLTAKKGSAAYVLLASGRLSWTGVDLFFVLSGFLIGGILIDARNSPNYFKTFYARRAFRILPLYAVVCVLTLSCFLLWTRADRPALMNPLFQGTLPWFTYLLFLQNFWMVSRNIMWGGVLTVTWSLAIEEQFYLTLPLLIRHVRTHLLSWVLPAAIVVVPIMRTIIFYEYRNGAAADAALMPCRADALLLGVLCAILFRNNRAWEWVKTHTRLLWWLLLPLILGIMGLTVGNTSNATSLLFCAVGYTWMALFYTCILLLALSDPNNIFSKMLRSHFLQWLASISYGVYLLHVTILEICLILLRGRTDGIRNIGDLGCVVLAIVLTLVICAASSTYFERPMLKRGHTFRY